MAEIAVAPAYQVGTLKLSTNGYTAHAERAVFKPAPAAMVVRDIGGVDHVIGGKSSWVLEIDLMQDHTTANSLSQFLLANDGSTAAAELVVTGGAKYAATVVIHAGDAGGKGGDVPKATVSLEATIPVYTAAA